jgi:hypothetical protein
MLASRRSALSMMASAYSGPNSPRTRPSLGGQRYPREFAWLAAAIIQNPMLNGQTIRLDGGQRFAPR